ncbi:MAG: hypothetical protein IPL53_11680 [Ignavibacteria bacterium]|nr:hypothetical protein [Ignavibacteria bacterium]
MKNINPDAEKFLELIKKSRNGKFKIYIGLAAGVGKSYRMLLEAHELIKNNIDILVGYIETHGREETHKLIEGLPMIPRKIIYYKGKELEELDIDLVLKLRPEVVIIDELAHTNVPGSRHEKRYQDVEELLYNGINVISALNIQHIESLNRVVQEITGVEVKETIPDRKKILVCIGNDHKQNEKIIRQSFRIADRLDSYWYVLYVETPGEPFENMDLALQRHLINNFKMATELGGVSDKIKANTIVEGIVKYSAEKEITKIVVGRPDKTFSLKKIIRGNIVNKLIDALKDTDCDLEIIT